MLKPRIIFLEKKLKKAGGGVCPVCYSTNGRWGWVPLFEGGDTSPYAEDGRCARCGAEPRTVVALVTAANQ